MLAPLLASLLGAIALPRAPAEANLIIHIPRLDQLPGLVAFFDAAGKRSALLRPSSWRSEFHPIIEVDIARAESIARSGIDPTASATLSFLGSDRLTCTSVADAKSFETRVSQKLSSLGEGWTARANGATLHGATSGGRVTAGYAIRGRGVCAVSSAANGEALLKEAARLLEAAPDGKRWAALPSVPGSLYLVLRHFTIGLNGSRSGLSVAGRATGITFPRFDASASSPYAALTSSGLLFMRAHLERASRAGLASSLQSDGKLICPQCDERELHQLIDDVVEGLTGNVALRVEAAQLTGSLKTPLARYFAFKHAYLAEVAKPDKVQRALDRAAGRWGTRKTAEGFALSTEAGEVQIGLRGTQLYLANQATALRQVWQAVAPRPGRLEHGADLSVDVRQVSRALSQISLFDALSSRELASLLAISSEIGPLLDASRPIKGWVESASDGTQRFALTWTLLP